MKKSLLMFVLTVFAIVLAACSDGKDLSKTDEVSRTDTYNFVEINIIDGPGHYWGANSNAETLADILKERNLEKDDNFELKKKKDSIIIHSYNEKGPKGKEKWIVMSNKCEEQVNEDELCLVEDLNRKTQNNEFLLIWYADPDKVESPEASL